MWVCVCVCVCGVCVFCVCVVCGVCVCVCVLCVCCVCGVCVVCVCVCDVCVCVCVVFPIAIQHAPLQRNTTCFTVKYSQNSRNFLLYLRLLLSFPLTVLDFSLTPKVFIVYSSLIPSGGLRRWLFFHDIFNSSFHHGTILFVFSFIRLDIRKAV